MKLTIATRKSVLALWQTEFVRRELARRGHEVAVLPMSTKGDKILDAPLAKIGGKGLFTKELENAMLRGEAQLAVHSLKDVPTELPAGLVLGAICEREDERDALLSAEFGSLAELPHGARVGTTSLRRQMQLLAVRPDLRVVSLRGNVQSRLAKLAAGEFDAIVLAMAAVNRLGLRGEVACVAALDSICAMGQAAIGVECIEELDVMRAVGALNHARTAAEVGIERAFVERLEGGCQAPIGIRARFVGGADAGENCGASFGAGAGAANSNLTRNCSENGENLAKNRGADAANSNLTAGGGANGADIANRGAGGADGAETSKSNLDCGGATPARRVEVSGILGLPDGTEILRETAIFDFAPACENECEAKSRALQIGREFAGRFLARGGDDLLRRAVEMTNNS